MIANPTSHGQIFETDWTRIPNSLIEIKTIYARVDNLLYYVQAERGVSLDTLPPAQEGINQVILSNMENIKDNSEEQFTKLQKFISSPTR